MEPRMGVIFAARSEAEASIESTKLDFIEIGDSRYASRTTPIELIVSGIGKAFAVWAACQLARTCKLILCLGTSGGLGRQPIGSLHISNMFFEHDTDVTASGDFREKHSTEFFSASSDSLVDVAIMALGSSGIVVERDRIASGDRFISDRHAAHELLNLGASIVDMECAAIAKVARYRLGIPFFALRWISDNADHEARSAWPERVGDASKRLALCLQSLAYNDEFLKEVRK